MSAGFLFFFLPPLIIYLRAARCLHLDQEATGAERCSCVRVFQQCVCVWNKHPYFAIYLSFVAGCFSVE